MKTNLYYRDITRTENLESYLLSQAENEVEPFIKDDSEAHLTIRVESERHRSLTKKPVFNCELLLKTTSDKKVFKVRKGDENFYNSVVQSIEALKQMLRKRSEMKSKHGRRHAA